jgi:hypothetical protein
MNPVEFGLKSGLLSFGIPDDGAYLEKRRKIIRESMRRQRERNGVSASVIRRETFPEGAVGLRLFRRALRFYWAARGRVRKPAKTSP